VALVGKYRLQQIRHRRLVLYRQNLHAVYILDP
jgi:hypothetical protein